LELKTLWKTLSISFSDDGLRSLAGYSKVILLQCLSCGFRFFDPALAGDENFYRELKHENYFSFDRPEFFRTLAFAKPRKLERILDVGCGSGAFLDLARNQGFSTFGLELNTAAVKEAEQKGHIVFPHLLSELDVVTCGEPFDLITMFQVMEHVPNPVQMMKEAAALLTPSGCISISVPHAGALRAWSPLDPHDWPPHHVSRWRKEDFSMLARQSELKLVAMHADTLTGAGLTQVWQLHNRLAGSIGRRPFFPNNLAPPIVSFAYRKLGLKYFTPRLGHSVNGYFAVK